MKRFHTNTPINSKPFFPKLCVICGNSYNEQGTFYGNPKVGVLGGWQWLLGGSLRVSVYGHHHCLAKLKRRLILRSLSMFAGCSLLLLIQLQPYILLPIALASIGLIFIYQEKNPVPFEFTQMGDLISFEFENEAVTHKFAKMNNSKIY